MLLKKFRTKSTQESGFRDYQTNKSIGCVVMKTGCDTYNTAYKYRIFVSYCLMLLQHLQVF